MLPPDKMPEAEVTLRLAIALIKGDHVSNDVVVAIDGAQVKIGKKVYFPIVEFLNSLGWYCTGKTDQWQCTYKNKNHTKSVIVHSSSGEGDLVARMQNGLTIRVESKKGPLSRSNSSQEYPLIREAIGQLMTVEKAESTDIFVVAVPYSEKFSSLAVQWRERPLIKQTGIHIVTVDRNDNIRGLEDVGI